jgi:hypothetical protein
MVLEIEKGQGQGQGGMHTTWAMMQIWDFGQLQFLFFIFKMSEILYISHIISVLLELGQLICTDDRHLCGVGGISERKML